MFSINRTNKMYDRIFLAQHRLINSGKPAKRLSHKMRIRIKDDRAISFQPEEPPILVSKNEALEIYDKYWSDFSLSRKVEVIKKRAALFDAWKL